MTARPSKASHRAYLLSPHWKAFREANIGSKCLKCGGVKQLALHHRTYKRVGKERKTDVLTLCSGCHKKLHALQKRHRLTYERATDLFMGSSRVVVRRKRARKATKARKRDARGRWV